MLISLKKRVGSYAVLIGKKMEYQCKETCTGFFGGRMRVKHFNLKVILGVMEVIIIAAINSMTFY